MHLCLTIRPFSLSCSGAGILSGSTDFHLLTPGNKFSFISRPRSQIQVPRQKPGAGGAGGGKIEANQVAPALARDPKWRCNQLTWPCDRVPRTDALIARPAIEPAAASGRLWQNRSARFLRRLHAQIVFDLGIDLPFLLHFMGLARPCAGPRAADI